MIKPITEQEAEVIRKALKPITDIPDHGSVKIQYRWGKPVLAITEETVKLD